MQCPQCGVEVRPGARFCNNCGAQLAAVAATEVALAASPDVPLTDAADRDAMPILPPLPIRSRTQDAGPTDDALGASTSAQNAVRPAEPTSRVEAARVEVTPSAMVPPETVPPETARAQEPSEDSPRTSITSANAPAQAGASAASNAASTSEAEPAGERSAEASGNVPPADQRESQPAEALPWPLPVGAVVGGRYRVIRVVRPAPDSDGVAGDPVEEALYEVTDTRGYEQCWSCGTAHGDDASGERFCSECGADMLARPLLLRERIAGQDASQPPVAERAGTTAHDPDGAMVVAFQEEERGYVVLAPRAEQSFPRGVRLVTAVATDPGLQSEANEDTACAIVLDEHIDSRARSRALVAVADGLGGHSSGQEASQLVIRVLSRRIGRDVLLSDDVGADGSQKEHDESRALESALRDAVQEAHQAVRAVNDERQSDMGSTLVAAIITGETAYIANVGDSRAYVFEDGSIRRITVDHSLCEQLIAGGLITPEERYTHPQRNQIYRSLGNSTELDVDIFAQRLRPGVRLLLCCDGLWEMVHDDELASILGSVSAPQETCDALVRAANANGGEDNISAVVLDVHA